MNTKQRIRMPELLVFAKAHLLGVVVAEFARLGWQGGRPLGDWLAIHCNPVIPLIGAIGYFALVCIYAWGRGAWQHTKRLAASSRFDLLLVAGLGIGVDQLIAPDHWLLHEAVASADKHWASAVLAAIAIVLASPLIRERRGIRSKAGRAQLTFLADDEVQDIGSDMLNVTKQAKEFAETVLASGSQPGLVFGLDAPWGTGKTSFLNLAKNRWDQDRSVIVVRFEPLRYATEPDLAERFIRDLCAGIQQQAFAPEFAPAANRYSRMLKGKTEFSFLGVKLSLEPSSETTDELLEAIDSVLQQLKRRLIVIIDDLDRLEPRLVNSVLFIVRRTFKLKHASYILCFDTEMLVGGREEGARAREFLEKFVTAKLSLFVDGSTLARFLKTDWKSESDRFQTIPAETIDKLSSIMEELARMVSGKLASSYAPLLGDIRKIKRFVNAMIMMKIEQTEPGRGDFYNADLIHLILLNLHYPAVFRRVYVEETEDRTGSFSVCRSDDAETAHLKNSDGLQELIEKSEPPAAFLLRQLFDIKTLGFSKYNQPDESVLRTRACFNGNSRNLEKILGLIVRFKVPLPEETFRLYKESVDEVVDRKRGIREVLARTEFTLVNGDEAQDEFWRILCNNSHRLNSSTANEVIEALIDCLPTYSSSRREDRSLRQRSVYSLALLLDKAGFGEPRNGKLRKQSDVPEIADRILGNQARFPTPIIDRLIAAPRGVLGWNDLMIFRLACSADRGGQFQNIYSALLLHATSNPNATISGDVSSRALESMRRLSQEIFLRFRRDYIDAKRNFFIEVNNVSEAAIIGAAPQGKDDAINAIDEARSIIKSFVIYQLINNGRSEGVGIGCGVYDETGSVDGGGIRDVMVRYVLGYCFDPHLDNRNAIEFGDFCLRVHRDASFDSFDVMRPDAYKSAFGKLIPGDRLIDFWSRNGSEIRAQLQDIDRAVAMPNGQWTYAEHLPGVFDFMDSWMIEVSESNAVAEAGHSPARNGSQESDLQPFDVGRTGAE